MENVEKRPVKLIANFVKFVKNKASQDNFPYDNISKSMTIATSIFWKDWDKVKTNQEQRMKFLTRIEQEAGMFGHFSKKLRFLPFFLANCIVRVPYHKEIF